MSDAAPQTEPSHAGIGRSAFWVALGILLSRLSGLISTYVFGHYLGLSYAADAFRAAQRIPNVLQNLFGEGVLSASFIPVYSRLLAQGRREEAGRVAGAVFSLLLLITSVFVLVGVVASPYLIDAIAPGFQGERRTLAILLVRIFFPAIGMLVWAAWCLGILNSHRKFFLPYVSGVMLNLALITTIVTFGRRLDMPRLATYAAWGFVAGSVLQFLIQLPAVLRLAPHLKFGTALGDPNVRTVLTNFTPAFFSRGVNQLSAYIDSLIASFLPAGAVSALFNAQILALLPVSLFGMSISVAELPAMSSALGTQEEIAAVLRRRLASSTRRIGFLVVPSAMAFLVLGDVVSAAVFQTGKFTHGNALYVWAILAGSAVGLVASTVGRLYNSAYYALQDTRTPMRYAIIRVALTVALGYLAALHVPYWLGIEPRWGAAGLTASAGLCGWIEFSLLRRGMQRRIGQVEFSGWYFARLWLSAALAAGAAWGIKLGLHPARPIPSAILILIPYGLVYLGLTAAMKIGETGALFRRVLKR